MTSETPTVWEMQKRVARRLLALNVLNISLGIRLARSQDALTRGVGQQNIAWGVINCGIALVGEWGGERRKASLAAPYDPALMKREARNLWRILAINTGLDVLYMLLGGAVAARSEKKSARRGTGIGVVIQGALLFAFDLYHTLVMTDC